MIEKTAFEKFCDDRKLGTVAMAERLGITKGAVSQFKSKGIRRVSTAKKFAGILRVDYKQLL